MTSRKKRPSVSVVIPTYNRGWIVEEAIESVLRQTYPDFELIVVDDGSTDDTDRILEAYADRIVSIRQENAGVSAARNRGIREASGELLAFLDSDDLWLPEKLERQVKFLESDPRALICQTEEIWVRNGRRVNPKKRHRKESGIIFERSLALCLVSPSAVMIRRRLFDEVGLFDESLPACEDYDLWLRVGCRYPVYLIEEPLIVKRGGHADQLSGAPGLDRFRIDALIKILSSGELTEKQRHAAIETLIAKCRIYANGCLKRGKRSEAAAFFELAEKYGKS